MSHIVQHKHSVTDFPTGTGSGQVPLASSLRTNLLDALSVDSGVVANVDVLTPFSGTGAYTLPANSLRAGELLRVHAKGTFGITGTPSLLLRADFGGLNRIPGVAVTVNVDGVWELFFDVVALEGGLARMSGKLVIPTSTTAASVQEFYDSQGFDPTIANVLALSAAWSVASSSNTTKVVYRTVSREAVFGSA